VIADAPEHRVEASLGETVAIGVVEDTAAAGVAAPCVLPQRVGELWGQRDLPSLVELLVEDDRGRRLEVGEPCVEQALPPAGRLPGEGEDEQVQI
jgi:hypothetical protein